MQDSIMFNRSQALRDTSGRRLPTWTTIAVPKRLNIVRLAPKTLPRGERFETTADARYYSKIVQKTLRAEKDAGARRIAELLAGCADGVHLCLSPLCPLCGRKFRRIFTAELLRFVNKHEG